MKSPFHFIRDLHGHLKHPESLFEHFHNNVHHAFAVFTLAIVWMLWGASQILTITSASRQRGWFLTSDFWDQSPSNANIMYAVFGNGTTGATAYTRLWTNSCVPTTVTTLASNFTGGTLTSNTIYIVNSWNYTLTTPLVISGDCLAVLGKGNVIITEAWVNTTSIVSSNDVVLDNLKFKWDWTTTGILLTWVTNTTIHNADFFSHNQGIHSLVGSFSLDNVRSFNNNYGFYWFDWFLWSTVIVNNSQFYNNNLYWIYGGFITINNSQIYNNSIWSVSFAGIYDNTIIYNNTVWLQSTWFWALLHDLNFYNNWISLEMESWTWDIQYYGFLKFFWNTINTWWGITFTWSTLSVPSSRTAGEISTPSTSMSNDRVTNPQNSSGERLISGTNRTSLRGTWTFNPSKQPIRYIFWSSVLKQVTPIWEVGTGIEEYWTDGNDYISTRYITEPASTLSTSQQSIVDTYFASWSLFTENWQTNSCSLSAFQVVYLNPGTFLSTYSFQDHTIYILTGGEYRSSISNTGNAFTFDGHCIAIIGNGATRITKSGMGNVGNMLYANNKHNIIIDNIKVDALYYSTALTSPAAQTAIKFDGATNNSTINNVQAYNAATYGIYFGLDSHHTTIMNTQAYNNTVAWTYLYYSSNYNVINNSQFYNNGSYGIWVANWSNRNTINNTQAYNNSIGIFWDLTTQENVINRTAVYNNSSVGIYLKSSSDNILNDVRVYNNSIGIRTLYGSVGNIYYGELKLFDNAWWNLDGTTSNDSYLTSGAAGLFAYAGTLTTGTNLVSCLYATNPLFSGTTTTLLNAACTTTWYSSAFQSASYNSYVTYIFGLNMYKQKVPVRYTSGDTLVEITSQYDASKYIAEVFAAQDNTPEGVNFVWSWSTALNTWYTTNVYTAGVVNIALPVTLSFSPSTATGYFTISWTNVGLSWTANNGDTIQIAVLTSTWYSQTITGTVVIWSVTSTFAVTTRPASQTPTTGSLAFTSFTNVPLNISTWSTVTISGIETGVLASISFDPSTASGQLYIYSGTTLVTSWTTSLLVYNGNQITVLVQSSTWYSQTITWNITIGLWTGVFSITTKWSDSIAPTTPILTYPLSGEQAFFTTFQWIASTDTGSWLKWYTYQIAEDSNFVDITNTDFITTDTGIIASPNTDFDLTNDTFYWRMKAKDNNENESVWSNTWRFEVTSFSGRKFTKKTNANLSTIYDSNEITLQGITAWVTLWASVDGSWTLYKNWINKGTWAFVQNGDTVYLTLKSSNLYNKTVSSTLTLGNRTAKYEVVTKLSSSSNCTVSPDDEIAIQTIYDTLVANYSGDEALFTEFLSTIQSMLSDQIDFTNDCNLQYLQELIDGTIDTNSSGTINTWAYIAPNCKEYAVSYDYTKEAYTSPTFHVITFFAHRDALTRYIDSKNPGDCHITTYATVTWVFTNTDPSKHIAPNGKVYMIQSSTQWYTSTTFSTVKYFTTLAELRNYINSKNIPQEVRSHTVDTSFVPQTYTAPNAKTYTIYKTDRWYMSYKLMKVRYFTSLASIQEFIRTNNL